MDKVELNLLSFLIEALLKARNKNEFISVENKILENARSQEFKNAIHTISIINSKLNNSDDRREKLIFEINSLSKDKTSKTVAEAFEWALDNRKNNETA